MQCSSTTGTVATKIFLVGVYKVDSGLNFNAVTTVTAGSSYTFTASVVIRTITTYTWSFGDSSESVDRVTSSMSYNMDHTYALPGTYDLFVGIRSQNGGTGNATIQIQILPATSSVDPTLSCPSSVDYESALSSLSVSFGMANDLEYTWNRSPDDDVTSPDGKLKYTIFFYFHSNLCKILYSSPRIKDFGVM